LALTAAERARFEADGRRPYWRFLLDPGRVGWHDLVRGAVAIDCASLSDPVLIRADGVPLYGLASVVDDIDLGVSHVIRGEDHVTNTAPQIQLFKALGGAVPAFAHLALLVGREGESLSKRLGSLSLDGLRQDGIEALALSSLLARLGSAKPVVPATTLDALAADFSLDGFGRAPAHFDPDELKTLGARILHAMDHASVRTRLDGLGLAGADERFWLAVRGNLVRIEDARDWWQICQGPLAPVIEDRELTAQAARLLPPAPLDLGSWENWTKSVAAASGRKGRALYHPLRLALTGRERGPELAHLLPLIGRERALRRLQGETA
jgi:glutamyl-tRNA synthetase